MERINLKEKFSKVDIKSIIFNDFWLKVISLGIAITTWIYITREITSLTQGIPT